MNSTKSWCRISKLGQSYCQLCCVVSRATDISEVLTQWQMLMRSVVFWVAAWCRVVVVCLHFGTEYRSHPHGSGVRVGKKAYSDSWPVRIRCPETSVNNYHTTPCNYPEDHRFHQHRDGSLKSRSVTEKLGRNQLDIEIMIIFFIQISALSLALITCMSI
jgi:hypothetical protein